MVVKNMYRRIGIVIWLPLVLFVTSCGSSNEITIEPYAVNDQEQLLIDKTGIGAIEYFKINGRLDDSLDIQFSVESYEEGELNETLFSTEDETMKEFKNDMISLGINEVQEGEESYVELISGTPSSLISGHYYEHTNASTFNNLITEKVTLEKDKPIYLAVWLGTESNELPATGSKQGDLPKEVEQVERAFVYKVLITEKGS